jgi:hypothetical protein
MIFETQLNGTHVNTGVRSEPGVKTAASWFQRMDNFEKKYIYPLVLNRQAPDVHGSNDACNHNIGNIDVENTPSSPSIENVGMEVDSPQSSGGGMLGTGLVLFNKSELLLSCNFRVTCERGLWAQKAIGTDARIQPRNKPSKSGPNIVKFILLQVDSKWIYPR